MCGRYVVFTEEQMIEMREIIDELNRVYAGTGELAEMKTGEIFPTNIAPVVTVVGAQPMGWGFPMYGKSQTIINARSETANEKPMFSKALKERRLVVPTTGFYEWTHEGKKSVDKFLFRLPGEEMLYLAGIWAEFSLPTGKAARFSILTTEANDSMRPFHNRMPVYIGESERSLWLNDGKFTEEALRREQPELVATKVEKQPKLPKKPEQEQMSLFG